MLQRLLIIVSAIFLFPLNVISQVRSAQVSGLDFSWTVRYLPDNNIVPVIGSPYLNRNWINGTLTLTSNDSLEGMFRFDMLKQQMEMVFMKDTYVIYNPGNIREIKFSNKKFRYLPVIERINGKEFIRFTYCEQVLPGTIQLFRVYKVGIRNNSYATNYMGGGGDSRDYYYHETKLLYKGKDTEVLRELPRNIKKLAIALGIDYHTLKSAIRNNGLDVSKENDVIRLMNNPVASGIKTINVAGTNMAWSTRYTADNKITPVVGSAYLNKDWMPGTITLSTNDSLIGLFRFNVLNQQMEMIYGKDTLLITNPSLIRNVRLNDKIFTYLPLIEKNNGKEFVRFVYCEQISPGQIQLFRSFGVNIRNNSYTTNYMGGGGDNQDYYLHESKLLYLGKNKEALRELPGSTRKLALAFETDIPTLKKMIREHKLDVSKEKDIIKLLPLLE